MDEMPQPIDKWGYIQRVSKMSKTPYGEMLLDLMDQCGKHNVQEITLDEAKTFYERLTQGGTAVWLIT